MSLLVCHDFELYKKAVHNTSFIACNQASTHKTDLMFFLDVCIEFERVMFGEGYLWPTTIFFAWRSHSFMTMFIIKYFIVFQIFQ